MGLLDDAIREHLELKRRRGADPTEMERLEREALGPVRRVQEEREEVGFDERHEPVSLAEPADQDWAAELEDEPAQRADDHAFSGELEPEAPELGGDSGLFDHEADFAPLSDGRSGAPSAESAAPTSSASGSPPAPSAPEPAAPRPPSEFDPLSEETAEYDVEAEHAGEREAHPGSQGAKRGDEDVLEETPEFLQDTPEHDRLWFEQAPPQDFDFDK
jgi:hypothetical protein